MVQNDARNAADRYAYNNRKTCATTCRDENAGGDTGGRPKHGHAYGLWTQGQPEPGGQEIDESDPTGHTERRDPRARSAIGKH